MAEASFYAGLSKWFVSAALVTYAIAAYGIISVHLGSDLLILLVGIGATWGAGRFALGLR